MPSLTDKLSNIATLRVSITAKGAIPQEILRKIDYKFRLECNYHSNRMEGGTLTKKETRSVMVGNITVNDKPLKDIREMKGHDLVMQQILSIGKGELRLSERRIKDIHGAIMAAETPEEKEEIGKWKTIGNHIYNYKGEKYPFTTPEEVPTAIHELLNWLNTGLDQLKSSKKSEPDPLLLCFEFHLRYLSIHPFTDGNGRTARLLTNLLLISLGYPPFWVSSEGEKDVYNRYLGDIQSYGGSPDLLYAFLAGLLERSLNLVLDAIDGKEIDDTDDWKKKVLLLKQNLPKNDAIKIIYSNEAVEKVIKNSVLPTIKEVMREMSIYDDLFLKKQLLFGTGDGSVSVNNENDLERGLLNNPPRDSANFIYLLEGFKKERDNPFFIQCVLAWKFENYAYSFAFSDQKSPFKLSKGYDEYYDAEEIKTIVSQCGGFMLEQIEERK